MLRDIVVTGGTGYIGSRLVQTLVQRGQRPRVVTRAESVPRVPKGAIPLVGNALDADSIAGVLRPDTTLVHLVGTPHPSPAKAAEFLNVDLASICASVAAAQRVGIAHLVYLSVAQPAPTMHAYVASRAEGERAIAHAGLRASVLRPWYVLGPGHRWPLALLPFYALAERVPAWRDSALRLGLVRLEQMVTALVCAIESPPARGMNIIGVPAIRAAQLPPLDPALAPASAHAAPRCVA
jgi:uncharacterized protein YbjT (DUF2867 family)